MNHTDDDGADDNGAKSNLFLTLFSCKWLQLFFKREKQVSSGYICFMLNLCCVLVANFDSNLSQKQALETFFISRIQFYTRHIQFVSLLSNLYLESQQDLGLLDVFIHDRLPKKLLGRRF